MVHIQNRIYLAHHCPPNQSVSNKLGLCLSRSLLFSPPNTGERWGCVWWNDSGVLGAAPRRPEPPCSGIAIPGAPTGRTGCLGGQSSSQRELVAERRKNPAWKSPATPQPALCSPKTGAGKSFLLPMGSSSASLGSTGELHGLSPAARLALWAGFGGLQGCRCRSSGRATPEHPRQGPGQLETLREGDYRAGLWVFIEGGKPRARSAAPSAVGEAWGNGNPGLWGARNLLIWIFPIPDYFRLLPL